ncbi:FAD-dependent oxidoreductase [Mycolicibacillus parakoreensis]|uniref:FAD-dependent oxidoreductase n=1 Tax=Mycolicibacillus parakoreensis TaxID=1069221 RepID=A0ABY3U0Q9_9MYCO|nr:FAD-dependent oxidoreductase [Mycolicibacillus parakoreensis]MCV7314603.1 FAD-dependent oxidoreductase [Mycolicibacillus parakoreensis]ULN53072.1 FAD-dependent oxidoreductase [Mycolicibacillus parakoreensis]
MDPTPRHTTCAIVGGGPAGMVLGLLLARAGVTVTVLEKHADFLRDFRGDTVHPTTMRLLDELGLWRRFAALPFSEIHQADLESDGRTVTVIDFNRLRRQPHPFIAMVPQWDLLALLADAAAAEPTFTLLMETEVTGVLTDGDRICGVRYQTPSGGGELHADLTVACDGRRSTVRQASGLRAREYPVNFDVWWFRLPRTGPSSPTLVPRLAPGKAALLIPRREYFQVAYLGPKGTDAALRRRGIEEFRRAVADLIPADVGDAAGLTSMDDVKHLDVRVNRLRRWHRAGLLCIGDAAHAMSPVGGIGINLAVQDAVGAATVLAEPLRRGRVRGRHLAAVHRRRAAATALTQAVQRTMHRVLDRVLRGDTVSPPPSVLRLVSAAPWLAGIPAYVVGVGVRPERAPAFARRAER